MPDILDQPKLGVDTYHILKKKVQSCCLEAYCLYVNTLINPDGGIKRL